MHFEFTDAEVAHCCWEDGGVQLRFSAARLYEDLQPRAQAVWAPVLLLAQGVEPWEALNTMPCIGRLREGSVLHASQRLQRLAVPSSLQGVITMSLGFEQGGELHLRCNALQVQALQGARVHIYQC